MGEAFAEVQEGAWLDPADYPNPPAVEDAEARMRAPSGRAPGPPPGAAGGRPGDDFNERGDLVGLLRADGWEAVKQNGGMVVLRRPGKASRQVRDLRLRRDAGMFYCFSVLPRRPLRPTPDTPLFPSSRCWKCGGVASGRPGVCGHSATARSAPAAR